MSEALRFVYVALRAARDTTGNEGVGVVGVFTGTETMPAWVQSDPTVAVVRVAVDVELLPNIALARRRAQQDEMRMVTNLGES